MGKTSGGQGVSGSSSVLAVFAFSCGVILLYRLTVLPPQVWLAMGVLVPLLCFLPLRRRLPALSLPLLLGFSVGLAWSGFWAHERLDQQLPAGLEGDTVRISGYVCGHPVPGSFDSIRFSFCVTRWYGNSLIHKTTEPLPKQLRLAWYGQPGGALPDHRLRLEVKLKRPHGTLNAEGFRYEDWLFRQGYRARGSVRSAVYDPSVPCGLKCHYHRAYSGLAQWVDRQFSEAGHYPLIASLLIGNRGHLSPEHWDRLKATGTIHLVAISGLHLGLIAMGAGFVARRLLLAVSSRRMSERRVRGVVFLVVLICSLLYAMAAGFTVPTRRALVMVAVASWLLLKSRQLPVWHSLVMALGLVLLLDPFAPLDQGFWLSFGAVSVLICVFAWRSGSTGWLAGLCLAQVAVFAGLWPFLELLGQGQPVAGLLANILAIPWVSLVVMPVLIPGALLIALFPSLSVFILPAIDAVLGALWHFLGWVAGMDWPDPEGNAPEIAAFAVLVLLVATVPIRTFRIVGISVGLAWTVLAALPQESPNPRVEAPEVRVWDVGQGLSALVRAGDEVLLYDTGPEVKGVFSSAESVLLPNLRALGIRRIDTLVISHADNDHSGGIDLLLETFRIGRIISGEPDAVMEKLEQSGAVSVSGCEGAWGLGDELWLDLWQAQGDVEGNDASCVLTVRHLETGIEWLFPGDIGAGIEPLYLQSAKSRSAAAKTQERVVVAPHHGSKTSSSEAWVEALMPDLVIYTAGYQHRYGHPHRDVTARYRKAGARALNTACSGELVMTVARGALQTREARHHAPFWIAAPGLARDLCKIP